MPRTRHWPVGRDLSLVLILMYVLLNVAAASCAKPSVNTTGCPEQNEEVLAEIIDGKIAANAPATDLWMRDVARACGWISEED